MGRRKRICPHPNCEFPGCCNTHCKCSGCTGHTSHCQGLIINQSKSQIVCKECKAAKDKVYREAKHRKINNGDGIKPRKAPTKKTKRAVSVNIVPQVVSVHSIPATNVMDPHTASLAMLNGMGGMNFHHGSAQYNPERSSPQSQLSMGWNFAGLACQQQGSFHFAQGGQHNAPNQSSTAPVAPTRMGQFSAQLADADASAPPVPFLIGSSAKPLSNATALELPTPKSTSYSCTTKYVPCIWIRKSPLPSPLA